MTPGQQFVDVLFGVIGLILNSLVGVVFDVVFIPLVEAIFTAIFGPGA